MAKKNRCGTPEELLASVAIECGHTAITPDQSLGTCKDS